MAGLETTFKALRKDGLVEFRREIHGISRIVATTPSSDLCLKALQPHFKSVDDLNSVGLGIEIEIRENESFAQPISQSSIDRSQSIDPNAEPQNSSFNHRAAFVKYIEKDGPCHYQDIEINDEIWSVDGVMIREMEMEEIYSIFRGKAGSLAHLIIMRYAKEVRIHYPVAKALASCWWPRSMQGSLGSGTSRTFTLSKLSHSHPKHKGAPSQRRAPLAPTERRV